MGLCYDCGFRALTLALALRLPGDYLPLEGPGVTDQQESVAGLSGHSLLTAFPLKCGSRMRRPMERGGGRESVADLLRHSLTAKGGNEGCWSGCLGRSTAENQTDRRASTAFLIGLDIGTAAGTGRHRPGSPASAQRKGHLPAAPREIGLLRHYGADSFPHFARPGSVSTLWMGVRGGHGGQDGQRWTAPILVCGQSNDFHFLGLDDELGGVLCLKLGIQAHTVPFDGLLGEIEFGSDFFVGEAFGHEGEDVALPVCEFG